MRLVSLSTAVVLATLLAGVLLLAAAVQGLTGVDRDLQLAAQRAPDRALVQETSAGRERSPWCEREGERRRPGEPTRRQPV